MTSPGDWAWEETLALYEAADDISLFETGWISERFDPTFSELTGPPARSWMFLTALAKATRRIQLGIRLDSLHYYQVPTLGRTAHLAASLDVVSDGRLAMRLGADWEGDDLASDPTAGSRIGAYFARLDEACGALTWSLSGKDAPFRGKYVDLTSIPRLQTVQRPPPPLCIESRDVMGTLKIAARHATEWTYLGRRVDEFVRLREILFGLCNDAGRDADAITTSARLRLDTSGDLRPLLDRAAAFSCAGADLGLIDFPAGVSLPSLEAIAEGLEDAGLGSEVRDNQARATGGPTWR